MAAAARLIAIVGPTASGKTALGLRLAEELGGEIVSCDSLQVYRGLDIGSAKPTAEERRRVPHHLIDIRNPDEDFSAADYAHLARAAIQEINARGGLPILVGGTGLYLRALLVGLFEGPSRDGPLRQRLEAMARRFGNARLHRLLRRVDPEAAARIHPRDLLRIVRALEVFRATRRPLSDQRQEGLAPLTGFATQVVVLDRPREELAERMERRTQQMLDDGLVDEVRGLFARGYGSELRPLRAIGYRQAADVIAGRLSVAQAQRAIVTESMQYAKRQRTWFRHQAEAVWFDSPSRAAEAVHAWLASTVEP